MLQICELSSPVDAERLREGWYLGEIGDVARVEIEMLHEDRFDDLLRLLDLKKELSITIDIIQDLAAKILGQIVEES